MSNVRKREKEIESQLKKGDKDYTAAFNKMVPIYKFIDYADKTNHCYVISLIYNRSVNGYTIRKITFLASMSDSTLKRNRKKYVECFDYCLNEVNNEIINEALNNDAINNEAQMEIAPSEDEKE
ncbi:MAG: hypothetical protein K2N17_00935 [Clostridia bacterium]|nr:hypothetical protein [Clostridia bacterium]